MEQKKPMQRRARGWHSIELGARVLGFWNQEISRNHNARSSVTKDWAKKQVLNTIARNSSGQSRLFTEQFNLRNQYTMADYQIGMTVSSQVLDRFKSLLYVPAPSSREQHIAAEISTQLEAMGLDPQSDPGGNVWVDLPGEESSLPTWLYGAHTDEISMVVTKVRDDGNLEVTRSGSLYTFKIGETPVEVLGDSGTILGVLSMGSMHIPHEKRKAVEWEGTWITTGLTSTQLRRKGIRPGSMAVPHPSVRGPAVFGDPENPMVGSWTFDDRLGCALQLEVLQGMVDAGTKPRRNSVFAFVHNEEIGGYGAKNLARKLSPEAFIAIDGAPMPPDSPLVFNDQPVAWSKDTISHYDHALLLELLAAGREVGVDIQTVVYSSAASDASMAFAAGLVDRALVFGCVRENSHGYELIRLAVLENSLKALAHFVATR